MTGEKYERKIIGWCCQNNILRAQKNIEKMIFENFAVDAARIGKSPEKNYIVMERLSFRKIVWRKITIGKWRSTCHDISKPSETTSTS